MKASFTKHILTCLFIVCCLCTSCDADGQKKLPNIFEPDGNEVVNLHYTSNADTVFLSWTLTQDVTFTQYLVCDSYGYNNVSLAKDATSCFLTHIPYNEPVKINLSLINGTQSLTSVEVTVKITGYDSLMVKQLFPDSGSITAGDGMYSIALPDGRSLFLMGDSYAGTVTNGQRSYGDHMYRNSYILYDKGHVSGLYGVNGPNTSAAVPPGVTDESQQWYWPGHGFAKGDTLYLFQELMYQGEPGAWGFRYKNTHLLTYHLPEMQLVNDTVIPYTGPDHVHFGAATLYDRDSVYIYAQVDIENDFDPVTEVWVARSTPAGLASDWEYFTGNGWSSSASECANVSGLASVPVSSQFNVFKLQDKYVLLTQNKTFNSGEIYTFLADNPWGPWKNKKLIYKIPPMSNNNWFTYNAMGHTKFIKDGMMLVSFNVNTSVFSEQFTDVYSYRPRFFWVAIDEILTK